MWFQSLGWEDPLEKGTATHFLLGQSHAQRSSVGYSTQGHTELDAAEATGHAQIVYTLMADSCCCMAENSTAL